MDDRGLRQLGLFDTTPSKKGVFEMKMEEYLGQQWFEVLRPLIGTEWFYELASFVAIQRIVHEDHIYPPHGSVFEAFKLTPYREVKVVIVGQDPYHDGRANGLAFANNDDSKINASLQKVMQASGTKDYTLKSWAKQGVLLLNRILTVRHRSPLSHKGVGWERFTDEVIKALNLSEHKIVYLLWGRDAGTVGKKIDVKKHMLIKTEHPAAAAYAQRGWKYRDCFSVANEALERHGRKAIRWDA